MFYVHDEQYYTCFIPLALHRWFANFIFFRKSKYVIGPPRVENIGPKFSYVSIHYILMLYHLVKHCLLYNLTGFQGSTQPGNVNNFP